MKKYLLFLTSLGLLIIFGLTGFIMVVKFSPTVGKKISHKVNSAQKLVLNRQLLLSEFEKRNAAKIVEAEGLSREELLQNISELPLMFQKNMGQWQKEVLYRASSQTAKVGFRKNGLTFFSSRELEDDDNFIIIIF